jgi:hypothetical protein
MADSYRHWRILRYRFLTARDRVCYNKKASETGLFLFRLDEVVNLINLVCSTGISDTR